MKPKPNNVNVFLALLLLVIVIIVAIVTLVSQNRNKKPVENIPNRTVSTPIEQLPMKIIKPKANQTITMPFIFEARVSLEANTRDLSAIMLIDGKEQLPLKVRKAPSGDIILGGTLADLSTGNHSIAIYLYSLTSDEKKLISNANYLIKVQ